MPHDTSGKEGAIWRTTAHALRVEMVYTARTENCQVSRGRGASRSKTQPRLHGLKDSPAETGALFEV